MLVDVAIPRTRLDCLTYESSEALSVGDLVLLPLRRKQAHGLVVRESVRDHPGPVRQILGITERGFIAPRLMEFYGWVATYYLATIGEVLTLALPQGVLKAVRESAEDTAVLPKTEALQLTSAQLRIVNRIVSDMKAGRPKTYLLHGVTGSGKTEVYLQVIGALIAQQRRALVMVPEIAMTPLLLSRFQRRFGSKVVTIHSNLSAVRRRRVWQAIRQGAYDVIIGPRSCVFLSVPGLGLIVVDEEHDSSYKEDGRHPRYHGGDCAVMRGQIENCSVILGSATPALESYFNAVNGSYELQTLPDRIDRRPMPAVEVVNLRREENRFMSKRLHEALVTALNRQEQAILFLNRRGYAPVLLCPVCGFVAKCPYCQLPMVFHKDEAKVSCHFCAYRENAPQACPACRRKELVYKGLGTQKLEELVRTLAEPDQILRLDRDSARRPGWVEEILHRFEDNQAQVLLGTQMVTKGFDFPNVTLVGIINADGLFYLPDFRSAERTFQLVTQVAGRAGRGDKPGQVIVQTFHPDQSAIKMARHHDYCGFYKEEVVLRKELALPPFVRLIMIQLSGASEKAVTESAVRVADSLKPWPELSVFGPKVSFRPRRRRHYRYFLLIKASPDFPVEQLRYLLSWRDPGVRMDIDVDPQDVI